MKIPEEKRVAFATALKAMPNNMTPSDFVFFIFSILQIYKLSTEEACEILAMTYKLVIEQSCPNPSSTN